MRPLPASPAGRGRKPSDIALIQCFDCPLNSTKRGMDGLKTTQQVSAPISYVESVPNAERAYHLMYGDTSDLPRTNILRQWHDTTFFDLRGREHEINYVNNGIAIAKLRSTMTYEDFDDDSKVWTIYFKELESLLRDCLCATEVKFFRYGIRKRHEQFPRSTGIEYEYAQPTSIAHVDATLASTREEMRKHFGEIANDLMTRRFAWVNVWRPLRGVVNDWPLCFCDAATVEHGDAETTDMVYPEYFTENLSLRHSAGQKWYYLSDHTPDEIIIFKQSDSDHSAVGGVPHCSFANPAANANETPRESIEARALVIF
ncbi:hypothetical protein DOTSEDRAFT_46062 [Dothistroma septosporum NZE10]|uniref:Methyltransferase n=1 Tax=Dothistroma septosporum (strain NZE10 / CBS 128990) TaxID=675120 RepID=N1PMC6_DOTSN|nr:hypothetical protein DOTSEDRAFT_46062 [Dothistroma septosporum NZE10]